MFWGSRIDALPQIYSRVLAVCATDMPNGARCSNKGTSFIFS